MISVEELMGMMEVVEAGPCAYIPGQTESVRAICCPGLPNSLHAALMERGFRHSSDMFYQTACKSCQRCKPMRIDPKLFRPSKKQRHILHKNSDIEIYLCEPLATREKYHLYKRYMAFQHPDSTQDDSYETMLMFFSSLPSSVEIDYRLGDKIVGITVADIIPGRAFSSVYHMFDPDEARRSIGVFSMLSEIFLCASMNIPYFYPGLLVSECRKMTYKAQFKPYQIYENGRWIDNNDQ